MAKVEIQAIKSTATDEKGNPIDCDLVDSNKKANPNGYIKTIQDTVNEVLRTNKHLRKVEDREKVKELVEKTLGIKIKSGETVARCCRYCQNTLGRFKPEKPDNREELKKSYEEYYSK